MAGCPSAIARLVPATLRIAPARVANLYTAGLRPLVILRHHHASAARCLSHHETTSGTAGVEGATAAAHRCAEDVSALHRRRRGALPVAAPTTLVADAVQAHFAPEKAVHCPASGRRLLHVGRGERDRRQNRSRNRNRGAENGRGAEKRRLAGAGAARGVRRHDEGKGYVFEFNPDNISCERDKIVQFRSGGPRRLSSEEGFFESIKEVFTVTILHLCSIYLYLLSLNQFRDVLKWVCGLWRFEARAPECLWHYFLELF